MKQLSLQNVGFCAKKSLDGLDRPTRMNEWIGNAREMT